MHSVIDLLTHSQSLTLVLYICRGEGFKDAKLHSAVNVLIHWFCPSGQFPSLQTFLTLTGLVVCWRLHSVIIDKGLLQLPLYHYDCLCLSPLEELNDLCQLYRLISENCRQHSVEVSWDWEERDSKVIAVCCPWAPEVFNLTVPVYNISQVLGTSPFVVLWQSVMYSLWGTNLLFMILDSQ